MGGPWWEVGGKEGDRAPGEAPPTARPGRSPADSPLPQPLPAASGNVPGFPGSPGGGLTHPPGPLYSGRRNYFPSPPLPGPALQSSDKLASRGTEAPPTHGGEQEAPLCTPTPSQECGAGAWTLVEPAALVLAPSLLNWGPVSLGAGCWAWWPQGRPLSLAGVGRDVGMGLLSPILKLLTGPSLGCLLISTQKMLITPEIPRVFRSSVPRTRNKDLIFPFYCVRQERVGCGSKKFKNSCL